MVFLGSLVIFIFLGLLIWGLVFLGLSFYLVRRNQAQLKAAYTGPLSFAPVNFTQSPRMNRMFFDEHTAALMQLGFNPIGDFTLSHLPYENYNRAFFHSPANTYALISQMRVKGFWSLLAKNPPPWFDFFTPFEEGITLTTTTNALAGLTARPASAIHQKALWNTPPEAFKQHTQGVNEMTHQDKKPQPVSAEGFFSSFSESFRRQGEFRQQQGYLRPEEVEAIARQRGKPVEGKIMAWILGKTNKG